MYEYVPAKLAANAPLLVLVHYCGGNAQGVFGEAQGGGIIEAADKYGFPIVLPQTSQNCWDIATKASLTHGGGGDSGAIVNMVKYALGKHGANPDRVYVTGTSSGAMMTQGLLAVYPDVFKGGSEFAGVPAGCWAVNDPAGQWSGPCAGGMVTHTGAEWGQMVKDMYPGYSGFRPRVQLWHGEADSIISYTNQTEAIKQWTNVLALPASPSSTTTVTIGGKQYKREQWQDSCGSTVLDAWTQSQGPHGTDANLNAQYTIPFLALDQTGAVDPQVAKCMSGAGGMGGSGAGGSSASAGSGMGGSGANGDAGSSTGGAMSGAGTGASSGGTGSTMDPGMVGASGSGTGVSGSSAVGGTSTGNNGTDAPSAAVPSHPGMSCALGRSKPNDALACAGLFAAGLFFGRRRRAERARHRS
jgi:poly(hydroxyalkanoate) depolymerase family esterase